MNKTKLILSTLIIIILAFGVLYGIRISIQNSINSEIILETIGDEITATSTIYVSETGDEAHISYYSNKTAMLTIIGSEYKDIQFTSTTSASGARYENVEQGLELWEKNPEITFYKDDEELFSGKKYETYLLENIISSTWVWEKTYLGTGPTADIKNPIIPERFEAFTLSFSSDGTVRGTTDCNNFSGTYVIENGQIKFTSLMSTLMYCEGSQEQEFISMIKDGSIAISMDSIAIEHEQTVLFKKKTE